MSAEIVIIDPGMFTSIQDLGRVGYGAFGVPVSGAMDRSSAILANEMLGNADGDAVMEFTLVGPTLQFSKDTIITLTGADMQAKLNGRSVSAGEVVAVKAGDELVTAQAVHGARTYLAVKGGIRSEQVLGSRSMCPQVTPARLTKGDGIPYEAFSGGSTDVVPPLLSDGEVLLAEKSPEFDELTPEGLKTLLETEYGITQEWSRMGIRFSGQQVAMKSTQILSSPVLPGTVQVPASGQPIVLMRDCQTTGGYPRVLQLTDEAIDRLAQKRPGEQVRFELVS